MAGKQTIRWALVCAAVAGAAIGGPGCAETSCEETRTCAEPGTGGAGGAGGSGATGGKWGTGGTASGGTSAGGGGTGGQPPIGSFGITAGAKTLTLVDGSSVELVVTITRQDLEDAITIDLVGLPPGVTAPAVVASVADTSVQLTLTASASVKHGSSPITVRGKTSSAEKTAQFDLMTRGAPGTRDNSFDDSGVSVFGDWTRPRAVAIAADGKIYVAGEAGSATANTHAYFLARVAASGGLDSTFGTGGSVVRYTTPNTGVHAARGVYLDAQGRAVVGGYFSGNQVFVARFDATGALDPTFATAGEITGPGFSVFAITGQGAKSVAAGKNDKSPAHAIVARSDANGAPDNPFGVQSIATINTAPYASEATSIAVDAANRIVVAGTTTKPSGSVMVARLTPSGAMDTFATAGIAWLDPANGGVTAGLAVRPDKRIVVGGGASGDKYFVFQLDEQGAPDATFGSAGLATGFTMRIDALTLDTSGRVVAAGRVGQSLRVARFTSDGKPDAVFGSSGFASLGGDETPQAVLVLPDGRALVLSVGHATAGDRLSLTRVWM